MTNRKPTEIITAYRGEANRKIERLSPRMTREKMESEMPRGSQIRDDYESLRSILALRRPFGSAGEASLLKAIKRNFGGDFDAFGNLHIEVGDSPVLWSCHADTTHHEKRGAAVQGIEITEDFTIRLSSKSRRAGNCLGADDGAGVWIMTQMLAAGVGGRYVFHVGEEAGCQGSSFIAQEHRALLSRYKYAIAFDRAGCDEIITEQASGYCASDAFAESFAEILADNGLSGYKPSPFGTYTDTNEYTDYIAECTNIGVGYKAQHGPTETQDFLHLRRLRDAMIKFDESRLVSEREPGDSGYGSFAQYTSARSSVAATHGRFSNHYGRYSRSYYVEDYEETETELCADEYAPARNASQEPSLSAVLGADPEVCAEVLEAYYGLTGSELIDMIYKERGFLGPDIWNAVN